MKFTLKKLEYISCQTQYRSGPFLNCKASQRRLSKFNVHKFRRMNQFNHISSSLKETPLPIFNNEYE